jgi:hypothetical protein
MAKPLGEKSRVIRTAIAANPKKGNKELAKTLNDSPDRAGDKFTFTPEDVAKQKQAMKKPGAQKVSEEGAPAAASATASAQPAKTRKKPGRKPKAAAPANGASPPVRKAQPSPADLLDNVYLLARQCGGLNELKRLVERLAKG